MDRLETARALRGDPNRHYNCCQAVLVTFCPKIGLSEEAAYALGAHFGGGMHMGSVCGALTGGLMVLGLLGYDQQTCTQFIARFRSRNGCVNCPDLLRSAHDRGEERHTHCDRQVFEVVADLDTLLKQAD